VVLSIGCSNNGSGGKKDEPSVGRVNWELNTISADGLTLEITALLRPCDVVDSVDVDEAPDEVRIVVEVGAKAPDAGLSCNDDVALAEERSVALDAPLGPRELTGCNASRTIDCEQGP
jgi:hypothetical protein